MRGDAGEMTEEMAEKLMSKGFYEMFDQGSETIQEQTVNTLVINVYNIMGQPSSTNPEYFSNLYILIRLLAGRLKEKWAIKRLDKLNKELQVTDEFELPLGKAEYIYFRDIKWGYSIGKGYQSKQITLADIKLALMDAKKQMLDIFTIISIRHNVDVSAITPPTGVEMEMPNL